MSTYKTTKALGSSCLGGLSMDYLGVLLVFLFIWACILILTSNVLGKKSGCISLPPGPRPLPIIGNILELGNKPHQALACLSKSYGPIMTLKLGSLITIVISSPKIAKEALQKRDQALSSRTVTDAFLVNNHYKMSVFWLPASSRWKNLRKIVATQMFTSQRLEEGLALRRKKVQQLLDYVTVNSINGQAVDIGLATFTATLNMIANILFSIDLASYNSDMSRELSDLVVLILEVGGRPNVLDFFPILRLVDPQGARQKMKMYFERLFRIFDGIINERTELSAYKANNDVLDYLLILAKENNPEFGLLDLKTLLLDLFIAGTDTSSSTVEWAMAELLQNPEKMAKLKNELKQVDGPIHESDISKLPYLQAIVKETFRLHPPAAFLVGRKAVVDTEISGFKVPKNAQILVNVWAMGRDPSIWQSPDSFAPERFLKSEIDVKGKDFELIPFGAGRRMCPGLPLAHRMVHIMLASLVHSFDWKFADGMEPENMDMDEQFGITLHKTKPLLAIPTRH